MPNKLSALKVHLKKLGSVLVAFSGGVDSTFLLKIAADTLGKNKVLAVTADSETYSVEEKKSASALAKSFGARHIVIRTEELRNKKFSDNSSQRCFYCKDELFAKLTAIARKNKFKVVDGSNFSDISDFRPGRRAAKKWGILSPMADAGLTKNDIRRYSKKLKLPTHSHPAQACLASRFAYGEKITKQKLINLANAERIVKKIVKGNVRVRISQVAARIEADAGQIEKLVAKKNRKKIVDAFKKLGFVYISLDLEGYRTGSQNLILTDSLRQRT